MRFQEPLPIVQSTKWAVKGMYALHMAKESLRFDTSRSSEAAHRTVKRLQQDKIRAFLLVSLMLLSWALIAVVGQAVDLNPDSIYMLCIASGVAINAVTLFGIVLEKSPPPAIHMMNCLSYINPYHSGFLSRNFGPAAPPPRYIS